jgi:hypothetical protein
MLRLAIVHDSNLMEYVRSMFPATTSIIPSLWYHAE